MKRSNQSQPSRRKRGEEEMDVVEEGEGGLVFEDPFGDDFEEEELIDNEEDDDGEGMDEDQEEGDKAEAPRVWRAGIDEIPEGEELEYDPSAYVCYHSLRTEWPCLSFDVVRDNLGDSRHRFPLTLYLMAGSQADRPDKNKITLIKLSDVGKTQKSPDSDDSDDDDDDDDDDDPTLEHIDVSHPGGVNRLRCMPQNSGIVASMSSSGVAHVFNLSDQLSSMMRHGPRVSPPSHPTFSFSGHRDEGYAVDWSPVVPGQLVTGDCAGDIYFWSPLAGNKEWQVQASPFRGHASSVEDLQWSPSEGTVFSSASADKTIKIWDTRGKNGPQISVDAHEDDVNVLSWNHNVNYLLATGCEDGSFKVWDLRMIRQAQSLANFRFHRGPVTSIDWAPHDESMLTLSSADNQVTVWDLSVESDDPDATTAPPVGIEDYPPQLMFIHQGQQNIKEIHHHPQIPGLILSTAEDSFNVFKPSITIASN